MSGKQDNRRPSENAPHRIRELMGLFAQRESISEAIKDICAAEKDDGGNAKAMRQAATRLHKANEDEREQAEQEITEYEAAYTNFGTPVATRTQAGVRDEQNSAADARPAGAQAGSSVPAYPPAAGHPDTASEAVTESASPNADTGPSGPTSPRRESLPVTDPAADQTGDPQPAAGPSLQELSDDPFTRGRQDFDRGLSGMQKPYKSGSPDAREWTAGWLQRQGERAQAERGQA